MKDKLRKLAKAEMKKRNLLPKSSIITGQEMIKDVKTSNKLPALPEYLLGLDTKYKQEGAQAFYFITGSKINEKTNSKLRGGLQKHRNERIFMGGIVSGYSKNGLRILIEFPAILDLVVSTDRIRESIDSHLWLELRECKGVIDENSRTISLGDFLIIEGTPYQYFSKGMEKYSIGDWIIINSGLRSSGIGEILRIKEDYIRTGWIFKLNVLDSEGNGQAMVQDLRQIKKDEKYLTEVYKDRIIYQRTGK